METARETTAKSKAPSADEMAQEVTAQVRGVTAETAGMVIQLNFGVDGEMPVILARISLEGLDLER